MRKGPGRREAEKSSALNFTGEGIVVTLTLTPIPYTLYPIPYTLYPIPIPIP